MQNRLCYRICRKSNDVSLIDKLQCEPFLSAFAAHPTIEYIHFPLICMHGSKRVNQLVSSFRLNSPKSIELRSTLIPLPSRQQGRRFGYKQKMGDITHPTIKGLSVFHSSPVRLKLTNLRWLVPRNLQHVARPSYDAQSKPDPTSRKVQVPRRFNLRIVRSRYRSRSRQRYPMH